MSYNTCEQTVRQWGDHLVYLALDTSMLWGKYCVICISVIYRGRAVPRVWQVLEHASSSVAFEVYKPLLDQAAALLPQGCQVISLADRGFTDTALTAHLTSLRWHWRIRIKGNVRLSALITRLALFGGPDPEPVMAYKGQAQPSPRFCFSAIEVVSYA